MQISGARGGRSCCASWGKVRTREGGIGEAIDEGRLSTIYHYGEVDILREVDR